jgi:acetylornithine/N-succinyldiaminopimelate aminotransferase
MTTPLALHPLAPHVMPVTTRPDVVFVRGAGSWLEDDSGRHYLDFVQGWAVNCLGHCHPAMVAAIAEQASTLCNASPAFLNEPLRACTELLTKVTGMDQVFLCSSGAEANEGAIKLARLWGKRHKAGAHEIVVLDDAFHGRTLATMCASGKPGWPQRFAAPGAAAAVPGFVRSGRTVQDIAKAITPNTCAVMLEPILGEAGVIPIQDTELRAIRALTQEQGVLLILDEIQTGSGRTGHFLSSQSAAIKPDILTLGKGLGGELPAAALLSTHDAMVFEQGDQGGTYAGTPFIAHVVNTVVGILSDPIFLRRVREAGKHLRSQLEALGTVRGAGLLLALELHKPHGPDIVQRAMDNGLLVNSPRPNLLRLMPALTVSDEEITEAVRILTTCIDQP